MGPPPRRVRSTKREFLDLMLHYLIVIGIVIFVAFLANAFV